MDKVRNKKMIDDQMVKALFGKPYVKLVRLSQKDISDYKSGAKKFDSNDNTEKCLKINHIKENPNCSLKTVEECSEPPRKKVKSNCLPDIIKECSASYRKKIQSNEKETNVLVLSKKEETDKFKAQFKSTIVNKILDESSDEFSRPSSDISDAVETKVDCTANKNEDNECKILDDERESIKPWEKMGKIWIRDIRTMLDERFVKVYDDYLLGNKMKASALIAKRTVTRSNANSSSYTPLIKRNLSLSEVEKLYNKYFSKKVQDSIYIIASILNIILLSNRYHKTRMDESLRNKKKEKSKEKLNANRIRDKHQKILESKLKIHFDVVVSFFAESEFEHSFLMFFLSIITVFKVLDKSEFSRGNIFENLGVLLWNSLKNCNFDNPKVISMFKSGSLDLGCLNVLNLIIHGRDTDPGIKDRMGIFFSPSVNCSVFEPVVDAVTSDSNDLSRLLENAIKNSYLQSTFKDPQEYTGPVLKRKPSFKTSVLPVQTSVSSTTPVQHWVIAEGPNGTYQPVCVSNNSNLHPTFSSSAGNIISTQPLNAFNENFSSTLLPRVSETGVTIAPKLCTIAPATITSSSLAASTVFKLKPVRNVQPIKAASIQKAGNCQTFLEANKRQYQLINAKKQSSNMNTMNATVNSTVNGTINATTNDTTSGPINTTLILCDRKNCSVPATKMCSTCLSVKYCSEKCLTLDWNESHNHNCQALKK